jgi:hypothetical protein
MRKKPKRLTPEERKLRALKRCARRIVKALTKEA